MPNTIEGTAARFEIFTSIRSVKRFWGEFLEIDRGGDADRQGQPQHHQHHEERAQHRHAQTGLFGARFRGVGPGDEGHVEALGDDPRIMQLVGEVKVGDVDILVAGHVLALHPPLEVAIDARGGEQAEIDRLSDQFRVGDHRVADLRGGRGREQFLHVGGAVELGFGAGFLHRVEQGLFDQGVIAEGRDLLDVLDVALAVLVELGGVEIHRHVDEGLLKGADPVEQDRTQEHQQEHKAGGHGGDAIGAKAGFGAVALVGARVDLFERAGVARFGKARVGHSYCSRYLRTM